MAPKKASPTRAPAAPPGPKPSNSPPSTRTASARSPPASAPRRTTSSGGRGRGKGRGDGKRDKMFVDIVNAEILARQAIGQEVTSDLVQYQAQYEEEGKRAKDNYIAILERRLIQANTSSRIRLEAMEEKFSIILEALTRLLTDTHKLGAVGISEGILFSDSASVASPGTKGLVSGSPMMGGGGGSRESSLMSSPAGTTMITIAGGRSNQGSAHSPVSRAHITSSFGTNAAGVDGGSSRAASPLRGDMDEKIRRFFLNHHTPSTSRLESINAQELSLRLDELRDGVTGVVSQCVTKLSTSVYRVRNLEHALDQQTLCLASAERLLHQAIVKSDNQHQAAIGLCRTLGSEVRQRSLDVEAKLLKTLDGLIQASVETCLDRKAYIARNDKDSIVGKKYPTAAAAAGASGSGGGRVPNTILEAEKQFLVDDFVTDVKALRLYQDDVLRTIREKILEFQQQTLRDDALESAKLFRSNIPENRRRILFCCARAFDRDALLQILDRVSFEPATAETITSIVDAFIETNGGIEHVETHHMAASPQAGHSLTLDTTDTPKKIMYAEAMNAVAYQLPYTAPPLVLPTSCGNDLNPMQIQETAAPSPSPPSHGSTVHSPHDLVMCSSVERAKNHFLELVGKSPSSSTATSPQAAKSLAAGHHSSSQQHLPPPAGTTARASSSATLVGSSSPTTNAPRAIVVGSGQHPHNPSSATGNNTPQAQTNSAPLVMKGNPQRPTGGTSAHQHPQQHQLAVHAPPPPPSSSALQVIANVPATAILNPAVTSSSVYPDRLHSLFNHPNAAGVVVPAGQMFIPASNRGYVSSVVKHRMELEDVMRRVIEDRCSEADILQGSGEREDDNNNNGSSHHILRLLPSMSAEEKRRILLDLLSEVPSSAKGGVLSNVTSPTTTTTTYQLPSSLLPAIGPSTTAAANTTASKVTSWMDADRIFAESRCKAAPSTTVIHGPRPPPSYKSADRIGTRYELNPSTSLTTATTTSDALSALEQHDEIVKQQRAALRALGAKPPTTSGNRGGSGQHNLVGQPSEVPPNRSAATSSADLPAAARLYSEKQRSLLRQLLDNGASS